MILTIDIGNTDVKLAVFSEEGKIVVEDRFPNDGIFPAAKISRFLEAKFARVVIASVVPALTDAFAMAFSPRAELIHVASATSPWGFTIDTEVPALTGCDRLANIEGALRFGGYAIVVDAGTATKFDVLEAGEKKRFPGGAIAPGLGISYEALLSHAAQLGPIDLEKFSPVLGYNTETAIRSGVLHGFAALVDGMVLRLFTERTLPPKTAVVATGGYSRFLLGRAKLVTHMAQKLTLEGLYGLAKKL